MSPGIVVDITLAACHTCEEFIMAPETPMIEVKWNALNADA